MLRKWRSRLKSPVSLARRNPIKFISKSSPEFFYGNEELFCLTPELGEDIHNPAFIAHIKDIIDYRTRKFYRERLEKRLKEIEGV
jgi:hypothetical protein